MNSPGTYLPRIVQTCFGFLLVLSWCSGTPNVGYSLLLGLKTIENSYSKCRSSYIFQLHRTQCYGAPQRATRKSVTARLLDSFCRDKKRRWPESWGKPPEPCPRKANGKTARCTDHGDLWVNSLGFLTLSSVVPGWLHTLVLRICSAIHGPEFVKRITK